MLQENSTNDRRFFATLDLEKKPLTANLKVVGVGGGGCNAVESMIKRGLANVEYIAINTDAQVLKSSNAHQKIQIGVNITRGLGAGADPNVGKKAAEEDRDKITEALTGADMVFINAGMGGGTGTGAAPIVASIAKSLGALVVAIVTKPFKWEGRNRSINSEQGIQELKQFVDSLIVVPNERLMNILDKNASIDNAFDKPNDVLYEATRGIADIIGVEGIINVDFADVRTVMNQSGEALMGCGIASGEARAIEAAQKAISSPLLEGVSIKGAKRVLINITCSGSFSMQELYDGNQVIFDAAGEEANIIFGVVRKDDMNDYVSYTVIATGFEITSAPKKQVSTYSTTSKEQEPIKGGFPLFGKLNKEVNTEDLEVPTIIRVQQPKASLPDDSDVLRSGFQFDSSRWNVKPLREEVSQEDEDSSSFLKRIMD